ncbi:MAG: YlxR family protein [Acidimicrobiales bacterium]
MCVGCREVRRQDELLRIVAGADGELAVSRDLPGRGAWLCVDSAFECATTASKRNRWSVALRQPVRRDQAERVVDALRPADGQALTR